MTAVAVYAGNCREYYEIMMATIHAGIIWVPVNWHFSPEELAYVIADSEAKVLFAEGQFLEQAAAAVSIAGETPGLRTALPSAAISAARSGFQDYEALLATGSTEEPAMTRPWAGRCSTPPAPPAGPKA